MIIGSQHKWSQIHDNVSVRVGNTPLDRVVKYKSLVHILMLSAGLAVLRRVSPTLPRETRTSIQNLLTMPFFNYCSPVWDYIGKGLSDKLQNLQNRAARIVTFSGYEDRSGDLLDKLGSEKK